MTDNLELDGKFWKGKYHEAQFEISQLSFRLKRAEEEVEHGNTQIKEMRAFKRALSEKNDELQLKLESK